MSQADKYAEIAMLADRYNPAGEFVCLLAYSFNKVGQFTHNIKTPVMC